MRAWRLFLIVGIIALWSRPACSIYINLETSSRNSRFASGYPNGPLVPNTDPSFIGLGYDWSGVGWVQTNPNTSLALLTPRQTLMANHYPQSGNIQFVSSTGQMSTALVQYQNWQNTGGTTDLATATFTAPMSPATGIQPYSILFLGYSSNQYLGYKLLNYGLVSSIGWNKINSIFTGQTAGTKGDTSYYFDYLHDSTWSTPDRTLLGKGDSGSPSFIVTGSPGTMYLEGGHWAVYDDNSGSIDTCLPLSLLLLDGDTSPTGYLPSVVTPTTARWIAASSNSWGTAGNWSNGSVPKDVFDVLTPSKVTTCASVLFDGIASPQHAITLSSTQGVTSMTFNLTPSTTSGFAFSGSSTLTLGEAGLTNNDVHTQTFNNPIVLRTSQQWHSGSGGLAISTFGSLSLGTSQLLYLDGSGTSDFEGVVSGNASGIAKDGSGTLILGNSGNSFSGQVFVHNGTLQFNSIQNVGSGNSALGAPTIAANGWIYLAGTLAYNGNGHTSDRVIRIADGPGAIGATTGVIDASGTGPLILTGGVVCEDNLYTITPVTGTSTLVLQGSGSGSQSGLITNGGTVNVMSLVKTGSGTWSLSGANSFTGSVAVNGGLLTVSGANGSLGQSSGLAVSRGTLQIDDSTLTNNFSRTRLGNGPLTLQGGTLRYNLGNVSGGTESSGSVGVALGENTLALAASGSSFLLSGGSLSRAAGATLNLVGPLGTSNRIALGGMASGSNFIDAGTFVNGSDYAVYDAGGFVRAMVTGANAWDYATTVTSFRNVLLTNSVGSQPSVTLATLSLSGSNVGFSLAPGQTLTLSAGGVLKSGGGLAAIGGGAGISAAGEYVLRTDTPGDQLVIATPLLSGAGLTKSGFGALLLSAPGSSCNGPTTIGAGTLMTTVANALPPASPLMVGSGAALDLGGQNQSVAAVTLYDGAIQSSGTTAVLTLSGSASGVTSAGVGTGGSISGITLNLAGIASPSGSHAFSVAREQGGLDLVIQANIADGSAGSQSLVKTGNGILRLSGSNTYSGSTQIQAGTLALGSSNAIPAASGLMLSGGTLNLGGYANTAASLVMQGGLITGNGSLNAASFNLQGGTVSGSLLGTASLLATGSGVVTITGSNNYSGGTTLSGGTLVVSVDNSLGAASGALTLNGGTLQVLGTSFTTTSRPVTSTSTGGGISVADPNNTLTLATQNFAGSGPFTKAGPGTLQLGGSIASTAIAVEDGSLRLTASTSQLTGNPALALWNVASFTMANHSESVSTINLTGGTITTGTGTGTLNLTGSLNYARSIWPATIQGNLALGTSAGLFSVNQGSSADLTIAASIAGSPANGLVKTGNGLMQLSGSNTYSGGTSISAGTLQIGDGNVSGNLAPGAVLDYGGAVLAFKRSDTITVPNSIIGVGGIAILGTGTTILTGVNPYSGPTTISAGELQIGNGGTSGSVGSGTITDNGTLSFNRSDVYALSSSISGSGAVVQLGPGTLVLNASDGYSGNTTISGGVLRANLGTGLPVGSTVALNGGVLESIGPTVFTSSINPFSGGGVQWSSLGGGFSANGGILTVNLNGGNALTWGTSVTQLQGTLMFGSPTANNETDFANPIDFNGSNRTVQVTAGQGGDFARLIGGLSNSSGTAGLIKTGNGLLQLTGSNTYNGTTTVSGGTLRIGNGGASGTLGTGPVVDNSLLLFSRSDAVTLPNIVSGSGALTQSGPGTLVLTATNTYSGGTTIAGGTLTVSSTANLGTSGLAFSGSGAGVLDIVGSTPFMSIQPISLNQNGTIRQGDSALVSLTGPISGTGKLIKSGPGRLSLGGTSSYSGGTLVTNGTLDILGSLALPSSSLSVGTNTSLFPATDPLVAATLTTGSLAMDFPSVTSPSNGLAGLSIPAAGSSSLLTAASQTGANPVPEPGSLLLLLAASASCLAWRVGKRRE